MARGRIPNITHPPSVGCRRFLMPRDARPSVPRTKLRVSRLPRIAGGKGHPPNTTARPVAASEVGVVNARHFRRGYRDYARKRGARPACVPAQRCARTRVVLWFPKPLSAPTYPLVFLLGRLHAHGYRWRGLCRGITLNGNYGQM